MKQPSGQSEIPNMLQSIAAWRQKAKCKAVDALQEQQNAACTSGSKVLKFLILSDWSRCFNKQLQAVSNIMWDYQSEIIKLLQSQMCNQRLVIVGTLEVSILDALVIIFENCYLMKLVLLGLHLMRSSEPQVTSCSTNSPKLMIFRSWSHKGKKGREFL